MMTNTTNTEALRTEYKEIRRLFIAAHPEYTAARFDSAAHSLLTELLDGEPCADSELPVRFVMAAQEMLTCW